MSIRLLICLFTLPCLFAFQNASKSTVAEHSKPPVPYTHKNDSTTIAKKTPVKEVKSNKTKVHHVKKVESNIPSTIN